MERRRVVFPFLYRALLSVHFCASFLKVAFYRRVIWGSSWCAREREILCSQFCGVDAGASCFDPLSCCFSVTYLDCINQSLPDIGASDIAVSALKSLGVLRPSKIQVQTAFLSSRNERSVRSQQQ